MARLARALAVVAVATGALTVIAVPAPADTVSSGDEAQFVSLMNQLRASKGLGSLAVNGQLTSEARSWSAGMASNGGLRENPDLAAGAPPGWTALGENVGEGTSVDQIEQAFIDSPPHYANLVDPRYNQVGVGVDVSNGTLWVTEDFMAGAGSATPAPPVVVVHRSSPAPVHVSQAPSSRAPAPAPPPAPPPPPPPAPPPPPPPPPVQLVKVLGQLEAFDSGG